MLWEILLASIVGFLAVLPLAQTTSFLLPTDPNVWAIGTAICGGLLIAIMVLRLWQAYSQKSLPHPVTWRFSTISLLKTLIFQGFITLLTLLTSSSYGLYQYHTYQKTLLTEAITVTATISSQQISDNISRTNLADNPKENGQVGTGYQRQIWQIDKILPFDDTSKATDFFNEENPDEAVVITKTETIKPSLLSNHLPQQVLVTADLNRNPKWQATLDTLKPTQSLTVKLALQPINQPTNHLADTADVHHLTIGFDEAAWLRQRGVQATAQLLEIKKNSPSINLSQSTSFRQSIEALRWQFRQKILANLTSHSNSNEQKSNDQVQASAILLGLLTGDRGLMDSEIKHTYQVTGISHLLAISGPHVMMLASFIAFLMLAIVKRFLPRLLLRLPARLLVLWVSVAVSAWYALLVGFELPAQRTVWMLLLVTLSVQWLLPLSAYRVLAGVGLLMLWLDTTAVMQAGFWLSFVAVGLLLKFSQAFQQDVEVDSFSQLKPQSVVTQQPLESSFLTRHTATLWQAFKQLLWLQLWLFVLMMPVVIWFFGKISFLSIFINLIAVPFLGLVVVPLDILAGLLSFLPMVGVGLSETLWQVLSWGLINFHHGLAWLIDSGFAKQGYFSIRPSQLVLLAVAIGLWLLPKALLPRLLTLPLVLASMAVGYHAHHNATIGAKLIVLDNPKLVISLWINGDTAWLMLADNRFIPLDKPDETKSEKSNKFAKVKAKLIAPPTNPNEVLEQSIYPLLAKFGVQKLTGVISQTPSPTVNAMVQNLSKEIRIDQYWLAGFDPLIPNAEFIVQGYDFNQITPKPCQAGQNSANVTAITGWRLNQNQLAKPLTSKENWQTQACFIFIDAKKPVLLMAGNSQTPSQMSQQLCTVKPANLVVTPYNVPLTSTWLTDTQAKKLHVITGKYANQQLLEDSQYAIADMPALEVHQAGEQGSLIYDLD